MDEVHHGPAGKFWLRRAPWRPSRGEWEVVPKLPQIHRDGAAPPGSPLAGPPVLPRMGIATTAFPTTKIYHDAAPLPGWPLVLAPPCGLAVMRAARKAHPITSL